MYLIVTVLLEYHALSILYFFGFCSLNSVTVAVSQIFHTIETTATMVDLCVQVISIRRLPCGCERRLIFLCE